MENLTIYFHKIHLRDILPSLLDLPNGCFPRHFPTKILHAFVYPISDTHPAHCNLGFTTLTICLCHKSLASYFIPLMTKYFCEHFVFKHLYFMFSEGEKLYFTHVQDNWCKLYIKIHVPF